MIHANLTDTIVALATPPGIGAIGVIRLSGPDAIWVADQMLVKKTLEEAPGHTAHFGRIATKEGRILDEALFTVFRGPHSYTGQNIVEISCHGSPYILQEVLQLCLQWGARLAEPGEFTLRAFLNGKMDLSQAEAVADVIASENEAAHSIALRQLRGGFKKEIDHLREELIHFASLVELELDFGEEDVEFADRNDLKALVQKIQSYIRSLIQSFALGNALKTGINTVIAGRPNAGKSTLLNALLNEERAIVSEIAGTTRDTIEETLHIKGVQFRLTDTAGIREAQDAIEVIGVQRTLEKIEQASILVYVWDITGGMTLSEVYEDLQKFSKTDLNCLVICNKMDRNPLFQTEWLRSPTLPGIHPYLLRGDESAVLKTLDRSLQALPLLPVSAKNQMNIEYLKEQLLATAVGEGVNTESTVVTNARHHDALRRADAALTDVLHSLNSNITGDFIAMDIRRSLNILGEITGQIGVEDLLGNIFSKFCIGK